jgi:hypothetical protein
VFILLRITKMNLNIIAYIIYMTISGFVTVYVGMICYRNGIHFIYAELEDLPLSHTVNKILLTGYYLVNLGYVSLMIYYWEKTNTLFQLTHSISLRTGGIILFLGILHYMNMLAIYILRKKKTI